jgi:hypothetical protein
MKPVYILPSYFLKIPFNVILTSIPMPSWWSPSFGVPYNFVRTSKPIRATNPAHLILRDLFILITYLIRALVMKFLIVQFPPASRCSFPDTKIISSEPCYQTQSFSLHVTGQVSNLYETTGKRRHLNVSE